MKRRLFLATLATALLPPDRSVFAQPKPGRIGVLTAQRPTSLAPYVDAVCAGFVELGWNEGRNLMIDYRLRIAFPPALLARADEVIE